MALDFLYHPLLQPLLPEQSSSAIPGKVWTPAGFEADHKHLPRHLVLTEAPGAQSFLLCVPTSSHLTVGEEDLKTRKQCVSKSPPPILSEASLALSAGALTLMDECFKVRPYSQAEPALWGERVPTGTRSSAHMVASPGLGPCLSQSLERQIRKRSTVISPYVAKVRS